MGIVTSFIYILSPSICSTFSLSAWLVLRVIFFSAFFQRSSSSACYPLTSSFPYLSSQFYSIFTNSISFSYIKNSKCGKSGYPWGHRISSCTNPNLKKVSIEVNSRSTWTTQRSTVMLKFCRVRQVHYLGHSIKAKDLLIDFTRYS